MRAKVQCQTCPMMRVCSVPKVDPPKGLSVREALMVPLVTKPVDVTECPLVKLLQRHQLYNDTEVT